MELYINGDKYTAKNAGTLAELINEVTENDNKSKKGIAIAVNEEVIPKSKWDQCKLKGGEKIELISAVQGG